MHCSIKVTFSLTIPISVLFTSPTTGAYSSFTYGNLGAPPELLSPPHPHPSLASIGGGAASPFATSGIRHQEKRSLSLAALRLRAKEYNEAVARAAGALVYGSPTASCK